MHLSLIILIVWFVIGSLHTAAMTAANVIINPKFTLGAKLRYVIVGGPPVWLVVLICVAAASLMSGIYKFKHRHVEKGQG